MRKYGWLGEKRVQVSSVEPEREEKCFMGRDKRVIRARHDIFTSDSLFQGLSEAFHPQESSIFQVQLWAAVSWYHTCCLQGYPAWPCWLAANIK